MNKKVEVPSDLEITLVLPLANVNIMLQSMHQQSYASVATTITVVEQQAQAAIQKYIASQTAKPAPAPKEPTAPNRAARRAKAPKA